MMEQKKYSSYAFLIAKSVLRNFNVNLDLKQFQKEFDNKESVYFILCQAPITNLFNSLIKAQIKSYEKFVQKRLIDYFILNTSQGGDGDIVEHPEIVQELNNRFSEIHQSYRIIEQRLYDCTATTNQKLGAYARGQIIKFGYLIDNIDENMLKTVEDLMIEASAIKGQLIGIRQTWRDFAIQVSSTLLSVGQFKINELEDLEQRAELEFLDGLG
jgi:hypothetical protein